MRQPAALFQGFDGSGDFAGTEPLRRQGQLGLGGAFDVHQQSEFHAAAPALRAAVAARAAVGAALHSGLQVEHQVAKCVDRLAQGLAVVGREGVAHRFDVIDQVLAVLGVCLAQQAFGVLDQGLGLHRGA